MPTPKDNHTVTGSPLMCLEFIVIHTIIWGFLLCILFYVVNLLITACYSLPGMDMLFHYFLLPLLYYLHIFFEWPNVMLTALFVTVIRCILRRTKVTLADDIVTINRPRHTDRLLLADFVRPHTVESYVGYHFVGWVFRRRYLIFRNDREKEVKYRLYEYSEKDLNQVVQLLTRINRTEQLAENDKTEILINSFQNTAEVPIDPRRLRNCMLRRLALLCILCLAVSGFSFYLSYKLLLLLPQYGAGSFLDETASGCLLLFLGCFLFLCRALWSLTVNAALQRSCPQKIVFTGNTLQIDHTLYSVNRIQRVIMNSPAKKLSLFGHYQITLITLEGTHKYWLGDTAGLGQGNWETLCRKMQGFLISCPAKLTYR